MFPLFGLGEVVVLLVDAAVMASVLRRWRFVWPRTFAVWLALNTATMVLLAIVSPLVAWATGGSLSLVLAIQAGGFLATLLLTRTIALRRMSQSLFFRRSLERTLGWGWAVAIPIGVFLLAMLVGAVAQSLTQAPWGRPRPL